MIENRIGFLLPPQIKSILVKFIYGNKNIQNSLTRRLEEVREKFEESPYFMSHEVNIIMANYLQNHLRINVPRLSDEASGRS